MVDPRRTRALNDRPEQSGPVLYWMDRERRAADNWALLYAEERARVNQVPLVVVYALPKTFLDATWRSYAVLIKGLQETAHELKERGISLVFRIGEPDEVVSELVKEVGVGLLVTDFSPLRVPRAWRTKLARMLTCAFVEVDARNIVPCWIASPKLEFAARTIRPKIHALLPTFLTPFPRRSSESLTRLKTVPRSDTWEAVEAQVEVDRSVQPVEWFEPGEAAAEKALRAFIKSRLVGYDKGRNDPNQDAQSGLSPYLHYGHLSAQRVALEVQKAIVPSHDKDAFLEELIVRRELSDNFCLYQPHYDSTEGFPDWAKKTLDAHRKDAREYIYSYHAFEQAKTHDSLWNAAQQQMLQTGKMHGYLRMYWAKKILEWTKAPEDAMKIAIKLNDRYELDGRDSNGYTGIAWSIGGVHDRPWFNRTIFGAIRFMSASGAKGKFDVDAYIKRWTP